MPDMTGLPAGVPPEVYGDYAAAQRQQMLAGMLMNSLQQSNQTPPNWDTMKVVPRRGVLTNVAPLVSALLAGKAMKGATQSQASLLGALNQAYAPGGQQTSPGVPLQAAPPQQPDATGDTQGVQPLIARLPGASLDQTVAATQPTFSQVNPRNPMGLPADAVRQLAMTNPAEYAKMLQGPESVQLARLGGIDTSAAARGALQKATTIEGRPGSTARDPVTGLTIVNADPAKGEYYVVGANGQVVALPITNDATLQAWRAGLTTAATQANTPRNIPMGGGVEKLGYPPTPPALAGAGPSPGAATGVMPGQPQLGPAGGPANAVPTPPVAAMSGAGAAAPPPAGAGPAGPARGAPPPLPPGPPPPGQGVWANVPRLQIPYSPGQTSDTFSTENLKSAAAKHADLVNTYGQESKLADQQLQYNAQALKALPSASVGPMSEWLTNNRQRLMQMGVPESMIPQSGSVTPTLELNKYLLNSALQGARQIYGPRMTQNEVKLQTEEMSPSAHMTADAIQSLIGQNNIQANYAKQRSQDYNTYVNRYHGDPMQFEQWYSKNRPLTRFASQSQTPPAALDRLQHNPQFLPDFKARYGWDPTQ